jgi:phosphatidylserine synthase
MNKKNISLILAGIMLLVLQFYVKIGQAHIDIFSDILAFILIVVGVMPLVPRNINFKKSRNAAFLGTAAVVAGQIITLIGWGESSSYMLTVASGLSTIFTIYFTYYFTEGIILEAKFQEKSAATRSLQFVWLLLAAFIFIHYIAFMSNISIASILVEAVAVICAIYYCSSMLTACNVLYMEGLPTKHMQDK